MNRRYRLTTQQQGFSLTELMIVVAIVGILGAVAYPSYQQYAQQARRTDAMGALLQIANEQEKWYLANRSYSSNTTDVWDCVGAVCRSPENLYDLEVTSGDNAGFTVRAVAVAAGAQQNDTNCATFTLTHAGTKTSLNKAGSASTNCWE